MRERRALKKINVNNFRFFLSLSLSLDVTIFGFEIFLQFFAFRQHFFRNIWNVYSLLVTIICLICNNNFKNINKNLVFLFKILALPFELYVQKILVIPLIFYAL